MAIDNGFICDIFKSMEHKAAADKVQKKGFMKI